MSGGYVYATCACVVLIRGGGGTHQPIVFRMKSIIAMVVKLGLPSYASSLFFSQIAQIVRDVDVLRAHTVFSCAILNLHQNFVHIYLTRPCFLGSITTPNRGDYC